MLGFMPKSSTMNCEKHNRKWASESRIGAYIRGEIKLEDIMHPSKIIKPKERHNRRSRTLNINTGTCRTFLLNHEKNVIHKDIESKIRPYIQGLKSLKDLVHPSKLTTRVISSQAFPAFVELVQGQASRLQKSIIYDGGDSGEVGCVQESRSAMQRGNFRNLFSILENAARSDAVIRVNDEQNERYVTVVVRDRPELNAKGENRMLGLIAKIKNGDAVESVKKLAIEVEKNSDNEFFSLTQAYPLRPHSDNPATFEFGEFDSQPTNDHFQIVFTCTPDQSVTHSPQPSPASDTRHITTTDHPSNELITQLYQKIQTLLEERIETLANNQQQFEKLETLQKENYHLRSTIAKIGEKLNEIEDSMDTLSAQRTNSGDKEPVSYHDKLRAQNQRLLKTIDAMNFYLANFESKRANAEGRTMRDAAEIEVDRYKHLYEKEVKNFKRHKRKCEAQYRQLLQRYNQLHQRLQELDDQNLEMATKLSYVPTKIQLACRQYQDIIKKLNEDLNSLRSLERKSKSSTFVHEKSYRKNFTCF